MSSKHQRSLIKTQLANYNLLVQLSMDYGYEYIIFLGGKGIERKCLVIKLKKLKKINNLDLTRNMDYFSSDTWYNLLATKDKESHPILASKRQNLDLYLSNFEPFII